ncbi:MAG: hypothetical protein CMM94_06330 [Rickettsiales bacterium]|nr:hypothetical protein [Rickettsiales bacterium]
MDLPPPRFRYLSDADFRDLKEHVTHLVNRAFYNLHGVSFPTTDTQWYDTIMNAALDAAMDPKSRGLSDKQMLHLFQDIIAVSEEHHRRAQEHMSKATNGVYLRTMALENMLKTQQQEQAKLPAQPGRQVARPLIEDHKSVRNAAIASLAQAS